MAVESVGVHPSMAAQCGYGGRVSEEKEGRRTGKFIQNHHYQKLLFHLDMHQKTSGGRTSPDPLGQLKALHYTFIRSNWSHSIATVRDVLGGEREKRMGRRSGG